MSIPLVLTTAGLAAIVNAKNSGTNSVEIAQVGFTQTSFVASAATTVIPDELARLSTMTGDVVADDTVHLVVRDEGPSSYALRGLGLYLAGGVLFASYGQAGPILQKTAESIVLLAMDIKLAPGDAAVISFGDTDFLNPPATTDRQGVVELATAAEALAGLDQTRAITPATLKPLLDALLKLAGGQTVQGNVGFGGAPPLRSVTAAGDLVVRNAAAQANYRNWDLLASGAAKGTLNLRLINDAGDDITQNVFSVDGATGVLNFAAQPTVAGSGVWHGGNLEIDTAASADTVAKRMNTGQLRAVGFVADLGAGLSNSAGYSLFTGADGGSAWFMRSTNATDALLTLQRKDGQQVGSFYGTGDNLGLCNKLGAWRFRTGPNGDGVLFNDAGVGNTIWTSANFDPASKAPVIHSHDWAQVTGKPSTFPPSAHGHGWGEISGKPGTFPPDPHGHDLAGLASSVQSFGSNGYMRIGSLVLVWGELGFIAGDSAGSCSFPTAFPSFCAGITAVPTVNSGINAGASRYGWTIYYRDQWGFQMINDSAASSYLYLAWGW